MLAADLDGTYGAYVDLLPGTTLATVNLISLFGLHRRLRGALVGHLAVFEMTSSLPNRAYGNGLRRLGFDERATRFFDEHVVADALHEVLAEDLAAPWPSASPGSRTTSCSGPPRSPLVEGRFADALLGAWRAERTSLLDTGVTGRVTSLSYVLPIRTRDSDAPTDELTAYLRWLSERAEVVVVDGSDPTSFRHHGDRWSGFVVHVPPADDIRCRNGKVRGVLSGLRIARHDLVVVADDDVRYDDAGLARIGAILADADLVRPQNHFDPLPWHARWDTARMLLNRSVAADHPGTLGVRRSFLLSIGGYDGNVLFENLELVRTVAAAGGRVVEAPDLFVRRRPPTLARFLEQRPRQAYDDWAQPLRFAAFLAAAPAVATIGRRRPAVLGVAAASAILLASFGRMRNRRPAGLRPRLAVARAALDLRTSGPQLGRARPPTRERRMSVRRHGHRASGDASPDPASSARDTLRGLNGTILWVSSQNGCLVERPHRQSAFTRRRIGTSRPSSSTRRTVLERRGVRPA